VPLGDAGLRIATRAAQREDAPEILRSALLPLISTMIAATPDGYFTPRRPDRADQRKVTAAHAWRSATAFGHRGAAAMSTAPPRPANNVFPKQLLEVLSDKNSTGIIEWLPHGHAFAIKNTDRFSVEVMPKFTRGKLTSFQRQLNLYGFRKVTKGADCKAGALVYFHPAFKYVPPRTCHQRRVRI